MTFQEIYVHRSALTVATSGAFFLALALSACGQATPGPGSTSSPTASSATTATPTATMSPSASATGTSASTSASWSKFTTKDGKLSFDYPSTWTIKDPAGTAPEGGSFVTVSTDKGKQVATLRTNVVTGSECTKKYPYSVLDTQPLPALAQAGATPRFTFESRMDSSAKDPAKMNVLAYGITSAPEPAGPDACPIFHFFTWPPSGAMFGGAYNPMDTTGGGMPGVDTPEAYMQTQEYKDIKRMITSLKPAS